MKYFIYSFLIRFTLQICSKKPTFYQCVAGNFVDNKCLLRDDNDQNMTYYLKSCSSDQTCYQENNIGYCLNRLRRLFGGEKCGINAECYSNNCYKGTCVPYADSQKCTESFQCSSKSFCNGVCTPLLGEGEECKKEDDCEADLACGTKFENEKSVCMKMFSIPIGSYSSNRLLCETAFLYSQNGGAYNPFHNDGGLCGNSRLASSNETCTADVNCTYLIHGGGSEMPLFQGNCNCSSDGVTNYCAITTDNVKWQNWLTQYKSVINNINQNIQENQHIIYLRKNNWGIPSLIQAEVELTNYNLMKNADECAIRFHSSSKILKASLIFFTILFFTIM